MKDFPGQQPLIYLITAGKTTAANFAESSAEILQLIETAVKSKINLIQIREKKLPALLLFELAEKAAVITKNSSTKLLVNDRADIARAAQADGVHLTAASLPTKIIRRNFPADFIIGGSAHSPAEAETARLEGANFVTFSPIFETPSKQIYGPAQGLEKLHELSKQLQPFPVIALGGIDKTNFRMVLQHGASGFAAIRFLNDPENLRKLSAEFNRSLL